jgi:GNAT superfamily N-acetyltransferase
MKIEKEIRKTEAIRLSAQVDGQEVGHAFLCLLKNDRHDQLFGLMEDVFVSEECRGQGVGSELVKELIDEAKKQGCYKLIACSRNAKPKVHDLYLKLGFKDWGKEFRINF